LREVIGVVPQVTDLFSGSLLNNITIGQPNIDMGKVLTICRRLGIGEFIENLPEGFTTNVGENGLNLSGGQKQRIAIARALYRDPEILILDEATSALDPITEQYVHEAILDFLNTGKTVIIIAHRLSTIKNAHKIIVLKEGCVKEEGTHAELMACRSEYYSLWTRHLPAELINQHYEAS
jgi:ATP-binding cassette subfamily B protein